MLKISKVPFTKNGDVDGASKRALACVISPLGSFYTSINVNAEASIAISVQLNV